MSYILTHKGLSNSAKLLSKELDMEVSYLPLKMAPAIRWGNSAQSYRNGETMLNNPELISACGNKLRFSALMFNLGIPSVDYHNTQPETFPVVIRKVLSGKGGEGIEICTSLKEWKENYRGFHWSPWYDFEFELGVHIFDGRVVKVMKKEWADSERKESNFPIRNLNNGYTFNLKKVETYKKLQPFCTRMYEQFGLRFARYDIGWDAAGKTYRVIEANCAPSLSNNPNTLAMYVEYFKRSLT